MRHWVVRNLVGCSNARVITDENEAAFYRNGGLWHVEGPFVLEQPNGTAPVGLFKPAPGASRTTDPSTSRLAGHLVAPRTGTDRFVVLAHVAGALGGLTADELTEIEERERPNIRPARNYQRRLSELKAAGAVTPKLERDDERGEWRTVTRPTRTGSLAVVHVATAKGSAWLREELRR